MVELPPGGIQTTPLSHLNGPTPDSAVYERGLEPELHDNVQTARQGRSETTIRARRAGV